MALGIDQQALAKAIGISFQQLQKYERAGNRVSASRLHALAIAMGVPVSYFFSRLPDPEAYDDAVDPLLREETRELVAAFGALRSDTARAAYLAMLKHIGDET
jgi:transcriptional regulator with XRE-family HTH domain